MTLGYKELKSIVEEDLQSLITHAVREGSQIEYKEALPGNTESAKKEFLADVVSFAMGGGDLVFGMREDAGLPAGLCGCDVQNIDEQIRRMENIIRDGLSPRIPGVSIRDLHLHNGKVAFIVRVPKSWSAPHMIKFQDWCRFYSRNSAGKYLMDVSQIRAAFAGSELVGERIRTFRLERIDRIARDETPIRLPDSAKMILHCVPLASFEPGFTLDIGGLAARYRDFPPMGANSWSHRPNFDGFLTYQEGRGSGNAIAYLQLFREGIMESVDTRVLRDEYPGERSLPGKLFESVLLEAVMKYGAVQRSLGIEPPFVIGVSFVGVLGYSLGTRPSGGSSGVIIDRDRLIVPLVLVQDLNPDWPRVMRPVFDAIWNAAGLSQSLNYDADGNWHGLVATF